VGETRSSSRQRRGTMGIALDDEEGGLYGEKRFKRKRGTRWPECKDTRSIGRPSRATGDHKEKNEQISREILLREEGNWIFRTSIEDQITRVQEEMEIERIRDLGHSHLLPQRTATSATVNGPAPYANICHPYKRH